MQGLPVHKHHVNPDDHYRVLMKAPIPELGARHPRYMEPHGTTFPAVVKTDQRMGGLGNYRVDSHEQLFQVLQEITQLYGKEAARGCIVSQLIQVSRSRSYAAITTCTYQDRESGVIRNEQEFGDADGKFVKTVSDWDEDEVLRERVFDPFVVPASDYLNTNGYFGWVCVNIVAGEQGDDYLVDVIRLIYYLLRTWLAFPTTLVGLFCLGIFALIAAQRSSWIESTSSISAKALEK